MEGERLEALGKTSNVLGIVEGFDMLAGRGDGDRVEELKELEVQRFEDGGGGAFLRRKCGPGIEGGLGFAGRFR